MATKHTPEGLTNFQNVNKETSYISGLFDARSRTNITDFFIFEGTLEKYADQSHLLGTARDNLGNSFIKLIPKEQHKGIYLIKEYVDNCHPDASSTMVIFNLDREVDNLYCGWWYWLKNDVNISTRKIDRPFIKRRILMGKSQNQDLNDCYAKMGGHGFVAIGQEPVKITDYIKQINDVYRFVSKKTINTESIQESSQRIASLKNL
jgi:hypothetical protein